MNGMRFKYIFILSISVFLYSGTVFADIFPGIGCWPITATDILMPGSSTTVYVDRDNTLDPIMRGNYVLSTISVPFECESPHDAELAALHSSASRVVSLGVGGYGYDTAGNPAIQFNEGGLGIEMSISANGGSETYFATDYPVSANFPSATEFVTTLNLYLVSTTGGHITAGPHSFYGFYGSIMAGNPIAIGLSHFYVDVILTSCKVTTPSTVSMNWNSVSSTEILSGDVDTRMVSIGLYCGEIETPVSISFASSNGYVDANKGIIKTSNEENNLGIQLTWESTGLPITMNQKISDSLLGDKNFNIVGKPVPINPAKPISTGSYAGSVTMMFSYR